MVLWPDIYNQGNGRYKIPIYGVGNVWLRALWRKIVMSVGVICRLVKEHGYGFIASNSGKDIFFHYTQLQGIEFPLLREGQSVSFKIGLGAKGFEAVDVKLSGESLMGLTAMYQSGWSVKQKSRDAEFKTVSVYN
jgi:CspA family cold shock protein